VKGAAPGLARKEREVDDEVEARGGGVLQPRDLVVERHMKPLYIET
jgi:hypothetical protein